MKIMNREDKGRPFSHCGAGDVVRFGNEIYIKTEEVYDDDGNELNAFHVKSGEMVMFRDNEEVVLFPDAYLVLN